MLKAPQLERPLSNTMHVRSNQLFADLICRIPGWCVVHDTEWTWSYPEFMGQSPIDKLIGGNILLKGKLAHVKTHTQNNNANL